MKRKRTFFLCGLATALLALSASPPLLNSASAVRAVRGPVWKWTNGAAGNIDWDDEENWYPDSGFPSTTAHGAEFRDNSGTAWEVDLFSVSIAQLFIEESVVFNGDPFNNPGPELTMNRLIIDATAAEVTVTLDGHLLFDANQPVP